MGNSIKKIVSMFLVFSMLIAAAAPGEVQAKTTKKSLTLYVGEEYNIYMDSLVLELGSSKKSVAGVTKGPYSAKGAHIVAKKAGKTTITVKTKKDTLKYTVTVKKLDVKGTLTDLGNGELLLKVKNNTKQTFDAVKFYYQLRNSKGKFMKSGTVSVPDVVAGETVYWTIIYNKSDYTPDLSKSTITTESGERTIDATYKNATSGVNITVTDKRDAALNEIEYKITEQNTLDKMVDGYVYILVYDADGSLIGLRTSPIVLVAGADHISKAISFYDMVSDVNAITYKVFWAAYYTTD